jgi:hypothetical protein
MSFGTFTDSAGGKVLPRYLPQNASSTSVIKITNIGNTPIPAPTVNNELLTIIDTAQGGQPQFTVNVLPNPPNATFLARQSIPFRNNDPNNTDGLLVLGNETIAGNQYGVLYFYFANAANPSAGTWTLRAITNAGGLLFSGTQLLPTIADGGRPVVGADFVFVGDFASWSDPDGANVVASGQMIQYNFPADTFQALPLAAGLFGASNFPTFVWGIPAANAAAGQFLLGGGANDLVQGVTNLGSLVIYDGGNIKRIGGGVTDEMPQVFTCSFDTLGRLWCGGAFDVSFPCIINGVTYNGRGIVCLSRVGGFFPTINALPFTIDDPAGTTAEVDDISNSYDGAIISVSGLFVSTAASGQTINSFGYVDPATLAFNNFVNIGAAPASFRFGDSLVIDADSYIVKAPAGGFGGEGGLFGSDAGFTAFFAKGLVDVQSQNREINWDYTAIFAPTPLPLSYIAFTYSSNPFDPFDPSLRDSISGSFVGGGGATAVAQGGATFRYIRQDGSAGDAVSATFQNNFATIQVIGDLAANKWDTIGTTGSITFNDV